MSDCILEPGNLVVQVNAGNGHIREVLESALNGRLNGLSSETSKDMGEKVRVIIDRKIKVRPARVYNDAVYIDIATALIIRRSRSRQGQDVASIINIQELLPFYR